MGSRRGPVLSELPRSECIPAGTREGADGPHRFVLALDRDHSSVCDVWPRATRPPDRCRARHARAGCMQPNAPATALARRSPETRRPVRGARRCAASDQCIVTEHFPKLTRMRLYAAPPRRIRDFYRRRSRVIARDFCESRLPDCWSMQFAINGIEDLKPGVAIRHDPAPSGAGEERKLKT